MFYPLILRLDISGQPVKWIPWQEAVGIYARDMVAWTAGDQVFSLRGGTSRLTGQQSIVHVNSIVAVRGENKQVHKRQVPPLTNRELFRRDEHVCLYCGRDYKQHISELTRDHVVPISRGGRDHWSNVVTACRRCNTHKGGQTPEQARMPLLAIPYVPNLAEYLFLRNRRILADQMEFLKSQFRDIDRQWKI
ncbi:MAG: HNH endonuclease [Thioalkalispiraceae bacterium]|jgi:5-methylcytosine-specific restriction endonuclease McrA